MTPQITYPRPLSKGDTVAVVSPASIINPTLVDGAVEALSAQGYRVAVAPHALGSAGTYSASVADRLDDLRWALTDKSVRAILCSRGGYGCVHLLAELSKMPIEADPKWLIGFSDVSALHALMLSKGVASIHGSMAKALALHPADFAPNRALLSLLAGHREAVVLAGAHPFNRQGTATGRLVGGNLAVLQALMRTPFDLFAPGTVLFIEDIAEPIYKVERILYQLRLAGVLDNLAALIVGRFTEYRPDKNFSSMEQMIDNLLGQVNFPVAFDAAIGHVDDNMPLLHGAPVRLSVTATDTTVTYL